LVEGGFAGTGPRLGTAYLAQPLLPLAVALPRMLENIEAELNEIKLEGEEERRLQERAELVRGLLAPELIT
jgi:hypothetical protein